MSIMLGENSSVESAAASLDEELRANFFVYRLMMKKELLENGPAAKPDVYMEEIDKKFRQYWHELFNGSIQEGLGKDNEFTEAAAGRYSDELADQVNSVSNRAFLEGYNAALNKGVDKAVAWKRIADAWGLDPSQMRAWVTSYPEGGYQTDEIPNEDRLNKMLDTRATRISEHESWTIQQLAKQTRWLSDDALKTGVKVWRTAADELVCPTCAPMDGLAIPIGKQFKTGLGKFFCPPIHINCRCNVELQTEEKVTKAMSGDPFDRDKSGRFATREQRASRPISAPRQQHFDWPDADHEEMPTSYLKEKQSPFLAQKKKPQAKSAAANEEKKASTELTEDYVADPDEIESQLVDAAGITFGQLKIDDVFPVKDTYLFSDDPEARSTFVSPEDNGPQEPEYSVVINNAPTDSTTLSGHLRVVSIDTLTPREIDKWVETGHYVSNDNSGFQSTREMGSVHRASGHSIKLITLEYER